MSDRIKTRALIDGDVLCHRFGAKHTHQVEEDFEICEPERLKADVTQFIKNLLVELSAHEYTMFLSVPTDEGFRRKLNESYKSNRNGLKKPQGHAVVKQYLLDEYDAVIVSELEADDCIGIAATNPYWLDKEDRVMCSVDKDFLTVPGTFYNWNNQEYHNTTEEEANYMWMLQTLMGDSVDGYKGLPRVGPKKASKILGESEGQSLDELWALVVSAYEEKEFPIEEAIMNARMARILRHGDYDRKKKEPILWAPEGEILL